MRPPLPHVELPFLIVHGNMIWPLVIITIALGALMQRRAASYALLVAAAVAVALYGGGRIAVRYMTYGDTQPEALSSLSAVGLAASLPGSRGEALEMLDWTFERDPRSRQSIALAREWIEYRGKCYAKELVRFGELDAAISEAERCRSISVVIHTLYLQGRYQEAAAVGRLFHRMSLEVAIAVDDWDKTAEILDAIAKDEDDQAHALRLQCVAALARTYEGKTNAFAALPTHDSLECEVIEAITFPPELRRAVLRGPLWPDPYAGDDFLSTFYAGTVDSWSTVLSGGLPLDSEVLFAPLYEGTLSGYGAGSFQKSRAMYEVLRGDMAAARAAVVELQEDRRGDVLDEIALRDGSFVAPHEARPYGPGMGLALRAGDVPEDTDRIMLEEERCGNRFLNAVLLAQSGDGAGLFEVLKRCRPSSLEGPSFTLGLAPLLQRNRDGLAEIAFFRSRSDLDGDGLSDWLSALAMRRDLRLRLGEVQDGLDDQRMLDRHLDMLSDLRKLTMLRLIRNQSWI